MAGRDFLVFVIRRIINAIITLVLLILLMFVIVHVIYPTPIALARLYISGAQHITTQQLEAIVKRYHLDAPLYIQFANYLRDVFTGNLGVDPIYKVPETQLIMYYLPITLTFMIPAVIITVLLGTVLGAIAASNRNRALDYVIRGFYVFTWSSPPYFIAILLLLIFVYWLGPWTHLPASGYVNPLLPPPKPITGWPLIDAIIEHDWPYVNSYIIHMILPTASVVLYSFGIYTRMARNTMLDVLDSDFVRLAYAKGLPRRTVVYRVGLRNALIPLVTLMVLTFALSWTGAYVAEDVYRYHGMGYLVTTAVTSVDPLMIYDITLFVGLSVVVANFIADILYGVLDPRVRIT
ncbi:ABC transporter permease [Vulcanisaeta thermophila]|uniref:ABC transporter permease n=1 Tax=Vulcanisaeta thermophila TaxID=867917 RepID=UPI0008539A72|nr:ABC transporter permease [Vulcanisaeta thermophila]